jgi:AAA ATPase domain
MASDDDDSSSCTDRMRVNVLTTTTTITNDHSHHTSSSSSSSSVQQSRRRLSGILTNSIFSNESNAQDNLDVPKTSRKYHEIQRRKSISVNKLNFAHLDDLYGREKETELLATAFHEICCCDRSSNGGSSSGGSGGGDGNNRDRRSSFTMIEGRSGSGKSAVAGSLKKTVAQSKNALYALGKFHLDKHHEPLSAIAEAMIQLLDQVLELKNLDLLETIQRQMTAELGPELVFLSRIVPKVLEFLPFRASCADIPATGQPPSSTIVSSDSNNYKEAVDHLNYTITKFIQIISTHVPVVIVCDDLQWSDPESIALVKTLLTDVDTKALMIVGCYRSNNNNTDKVDTLIFIVCHNCTTKLSR